MTEQTIPEQKALPPETEGTDSQSSSGFGGRTDGAVGLDLGLAPSSFSTGRQHADEGAPDSLGAPRAGGVVRQTKHPMPRPKEHPFRQRMREAAEKAAAEKTAREASSQTVAAPSDAVEQTSDAGVQDAEFVERADTGT